MNDFDIIANKAAELGCKVCPNEPLKNYTSFKIGGACPYLIKINSEESCRILLMTAESLSVPYIVIGKGTNIVADDSGISAVVFYMGSDFSKISLINENTLFCQAGASLSKLCQTALENELTGLEFAWGIPGSVGGAVYMNAGAYGGEIKDVIVSANALDCRGNTYKHDKNSLEMSYRKSVFSENKQVITSAVFQLAKGSYNSIKSAMDEIMEKRKSKQPLEYPSAGSMFKRPQGSYASLLIEQCGLKGLSVGGAEVSTKHSGFIINKNNASFDDVMQLVKKVQDIVYKQTGYVLEQEPVIVSDRYIG
mgnify:CR=1 FL=1|jgi:UDP-N-acetylmuramate dehydrogenase